ncbi:hypothetical protein E8E13_011516 [Curvularia kusanoi]|uniref:Arrestin-like N-terminal domain-containing protein n=1 Tax=Curvularia kusanoi TaxID=90978 RepID=A0A9P4TP92_CURKU|nr:hypothetical protein E8E13_011516 [Curvularia kusanoi]
MHPKPSNKRLPIYIDLERPHDYFTGGDPVRGTVRVHPTERPHSIKIIFEGLCKIKIKEGSGKSERTYKDQMQFFTVALVLFNSETNGESYDIVNRGIEEDGKVALPFATTFPHEVAEDPNTHYKPRQGYEHTKGYPLPSTVHYEEHIIEYSLKVYVYKKLARVPEEIIFLTLPFRPSPPPPTPNALVQPFHPRRSKLTIKSQLLNPENPQHPDVLTKLKWATRSKYYNTIPEASWMLNAQCPYRLVAGQPIPISFSFPHSGCTPERSEEPTVYIRQVRVKLTSILEARIPYIGLTGERDIVKDYPRDVISKVWLGQGRALRDGLRLAELGPLTLPSTTPPSFKSYGLRLHYRIKVVVEGECAGESFAMDVLRDVCEVVFERSGQDPPAPPPLETAEATQAEEILPVYEPAPDYDNVPKKAD